MKKRSSLMILAAALFTLPLMGQIAPPAQPRARTSPHETVSGNITGTNPTRVVLSYGRPFSKAPGNAGTIRKIWGGLVPWGQVWRLGADEATILITEKPLVFGEVTIPAGACSVYLLPEENGTSKLIFNKKVGQWGINNQQQAYPEDMKATEIGRVDLKKDTLNAQVDQFTMAIAPRQGGGGGNLRLWWETTMFSVDFTVKP